MWITKKIEPKWHSYSQRYPHYPQTTNITKCKPKYYKTGNIKWKTVIFMT